MRVLYFMFLICGPTWPAPDAAGAAPSLARFIELGVCCQPCRSTYPPAAQVRPSVGPLAARKAVAGQPRQRDIIGDNRTYSELIPGISGHFRAYSGHFRASSDTRGSSCAVLSVAGSRTVMPVACRMDCRRIASVGRVACRIAPRRITCRIARRPLTSRHSSAPPRRPLSPCRDHRLARRTPVVGHAPAQHTPVADAANRCVACGFTCQYRGVLSTPVRRRG